MKEIESLRIYQLAVEIGEVVWQIVNSWDDKFAKWTVGKQWVDSADSILLQLRKGIIETRKVTSGNAFNIRFHS